MKTCGKCGESKPLSEYYKNRKRSDGVQTYCKTCSAVIDAARKPKAAPRAESIVAKAKRGAAERRAIHELEKQDLREMPVKICRRCEQAKPRSDYTVDTRYDDGCYPYCAACRKEWRQGRRERQRELELNWREKNGDRARELGRNHYARHKETIAPKRRAYDRERYRNDPMVKRRKDIQTAQKNRRRRALLYGIKTEHHTEQEWQQLCEKYNHRCLRCGEQKPLTRDHIIPVTSGGVDTIDNIQPLCKVCNSQKNNRTIDYRPE